MSRSVTSPSDLADAIRPVTDGHIAAINLRSARLQAWGAFWRGSGRPGLAGAIVEHELLAAQFFGDSGAFDRLARLAEHLVQQEPDTIETSLVCAHVASATHRFAEAADHLERAAALGADPDIVERQSLSLRQATGSDLDRVLALRRSRPDRWEELVPLAALLVDLGAVDEAEAVYKRALVDYRGGSPLACAWVCFEVGVLWGERAACPRPDLAAQWYQMALDYLPAYVKARVHLSEILLERGARGEAVEVLAPAMASGDPEVFWRLAQVADPSDAPGYLQAAHAGFEGLLARHTLAFADHAAEFFLAEGDDPRRAHCLAQVNLSNRPTLRAYELALKAALAAEELPAAEELVLVGRQRWGETAAFTRSSLAEYGRNPSSGAG